jgi:uridine kinase
MSNVIKEIFINKYGDNKLKEILSSNIFWIGLFVKVILALTLASNFLTNLFIPFTDYYVSSGFNDPYKHFVDAKMGNAFPYPALMLYIVSIPRILFGSLFDFSSISFSTIFLTRLPILLADFLILVILSRLIKGNNKKILIYYWLSPILIYINYIHGQLDVIPISILFISLYFLFKRKFEYSSIFLGLAIASKTSMVIVLPFYFAYLLYSKTFDIKKLTLNFLIIILTFFAINSPYIFSSSFFEMVLNNKEQIKIFDFRYNFPNGNILYFVPLAYLFLFITAINLKGFSKDVYVMFLGFSFGIIALMVSPMQGWYYWIIPFFIYFHCKRLNTKFDLTAILFVSLQISYFVYFLFIENSDYLQIFQIISPAISESSNLYSILQNKGLDADKISNLSFTLLQAMLLANCIFIYKSGVKSYANYKIFSHPFLLGICGDSGAGKTTISNAIESIFKDRNTTIIHGDDMHKWERGDENWDKLTHLNPKSNFLHDEISQLKAIKNSEAISRRHYDHNSGKFTKEKEFKPNNLVIFEGLHSFYIKQMRDLYDLKIFINPSEDLRKYWKVTRDTKKRGYSKNKIIKQIDDRQKDSKKFINSQLKYGDIIIEITSGKKLKNNAKDAYLKITATNSFYLEPLFNELSKVNSINSRHEYEDEDKQFIEVRGNISSQDIELAAYNLLLGKELEDLGINNPSWDKDYLGIIQLFVTYCIVKNLLI